MVFNQNHTSDNETKKFEDDGSGNPAVRCKLSGAIKLSVGAVYEILDHRGFSLFKIDEATGDVYIKGKLVKV